MHNEHHDFAIRLMGKKYPDILYLGDGFDGICYQIQNGHVLKILTDDMLNFDRKIDEEGYYDEQITLAKAEQTGSSLCPEIYALGTVLGMPAIIREDLKDILTPEQKSRKEEFNNHLKLLPYIYSIFLEEGREIDDKTRKLIKESYEHLPDFFDYKFIAKYADFCHRMDKRHDILVQDLHIDNFGYDKNGNVKIRDVSRFVIYDTSYIDTLRFEEKLDDMIGCHTPSFSM